MNYLRTPDVYFKAAVIALLSGRLWQYLFWDTPYHAWSPAVAWLLGGWMLMALLATLLDLRRWCLLLLGGATAILAGQFVWAWALRDFPWPYLVEHGLAIFTPLILVLWVEKKDPQLWLARIATALTFLGHGCYALGWPFPTPPHFLHMTQHLTGLEVEGALVLLQVVGLIDLIIVGVLLLNLPFKGWLLYAAFWGLATAFARPITYVTPETFGGDLHRWAMEMVFRLPHGLVPLGMWWASLKREGRVAVEGKSARSPAAGGE